MVSGILERDTAAEAVAEQVKAAGIGLSDHHIEILTHLSHGIGAWIGWLDAFSGATIIEGNDPVALGHAAPPCVAEPPLGSITRRTRHRKADDVLG